MYVCVYVINDCFVVRMIMFSGEILFSTSVIASHSCRTGTFGECICINDCFVVRMIMFSGEILFSTSVIASHSCRTGTFGE